METNHSNMEHLEWNALLDKYLTTQKMLSEEYEELNEIQRVIIQELKKAFKRIKNNDKQFCDFQGSGEEER